MPRKYFHVTSSLNRQSIQQHGLDWRLMSATHGIAGVPGTPNVPEVDGIFLLGSEDEIEWFAQMGLEQDHQAVDVWEVTLADDANLVGSPDGYQYSPEPIPADSLRLHTQGWTAREPGHVAGDFFHAIYYGDGAVDEGLLAADVEITYVDGRVGRGLEAVRAWAKARAHGTPPAPQPDADGVFRMVISNSTSFSIEGLEADRCLVSPEGDSDFWTIVRIRDNRIVELRECRTRRQAGVEDE